MRWALLLLAASTLLGIWFFYKDADPELGLREGERDFENETKEDASAAGLPRRSPEAAAELKSGSAVALSDREKFQTRPVRCLDALTGAPKGSVVFHVYNPGMMPAEAEARDLSPLEAACECSLEFTTDSEGCAQVPLVAGDSVVVMGDGVYDSVDVNWKGDQEIVLELKPLTWFEVEVVDQDGSPVVGVSLALVSRYSGLRQIREELWHARTKGPGGRAWLPWLTTNWTKSTAVAVKGSSPQPIELEVDRKKIRDGIRLVVPDDGDLRMPKERNGDSQAREVDAIRFEVVPKRKSIIVKGRFLDLAGQPLRLTTAGYVKAVRPYRGPRSPDVEEGVVTTDEEGRFQFGFSPERHAEDLHYLLKFKIKRLDQVDLFHRVDVREFEEGLTDLGDLNLFELPEAVSGRVLDGGGRPVSGAKIVGESTADTLRWIAMEHFRTQSDEEGFFEIHGDFESEDVRITVEKEGFLPAYSQVSRGQVDHEVRLKKDVRGTLTLTLEALGGGTLTELSIRLDGIEGEDKQVRAAANAEGSISVSVPVGRYRLRVFGEGLEGALAELGPITIEEGASQNLGLLRISYTFRRIKLVAVDSTTGERIPSLELRDEHGKELYAQPTWSCGRRDESFLVPEIPLRLNISSKNYRSQWLLVDRADSRVRLERLESVTLNTLGLSQLPAAYQIEARLLPRSGSRMPEMEALLDDDGVAELFAVKPGRYRVQIELKAKRRGLRSYLISQDPIPYVDVLDKKEPQRFLIKVDQLALQEALNWLNKDD